ncbi:lysylphosphatidylglycerol synthase domain-containing protein, partial [uncultured Varibaculum sp.]|uniref:lysylphosphatidylglycerol synthase domain-containing protein n=1 Tax=uncultured Varibaculum sp. TaxID=413896 RepID=UPI0028039DF1
SVIPTPGGLGPVEAALTAGLQVAGVPGAIALSGALLYRLLTFWMRAPIGWLAMRYLQRRDVL